MTAQSSSSSSSSSADDISCVDVLQLSLSYDECYASSGENSELDNSSDFSLLGDCLAWNNEHDDDDECGACIAVFRDCSLSLETGDPGSPQRVVCASISLLQRIGGGRFGDVYDARIECSSPSLDNAPALSSFPIAVKVLKQGWNRERTFRQEVSSLRRLRSVRGVVDLLATRPDQCWLVMPKLQPIETWAIKHAAHHRGDDGDGDGDGAGGVDGSARQCTLQQQRASSILIDVATQLSVTMHALHTQNPPILHRDVTLDNLLIDDRPCHTTATTGDGGGAGFRVVLADLGVSASHKELSVGPIKLPPDGNPSTRAPEVIQGACGLPSDVYSFGCAMDHLASLLGVHPPPPPPLDASHPSASTPSAAGVHRIFQACRAPSPSARPEWPVIIDALKLVAHESPTSLECAGPPPAPSCW